MDMDRPTFYEVISDAFRNSGLSLAEIASRLDAHGYPVSKGTLSRWASGTVLPGRRSLPILRLLPDVLELSLEHRGRLNQAVNQLAGGAGAPRLVIRRMNTLGALDYFTGRQRELRQLSAQLLERRPVSISGLGGIGKTTLARQLLTVTGDQFAMGCDGLQLHPGQQLPEILALVIHLLGLPIAFESGQPGQVEAALRALHTETGDMDLLLLLDNVEREAQVGRLLAAAPAITWITTSRRRLDFRDWVIFPLALPTPAASRRMLLHNSDLLATRANDSPAAKIAARLGHLPIALRIAAGLIRVGSFSGLADLDRWLEAEGIQALQNDDEEKNLLTFFARLLDRLPLEVQRLFILCGAFAQRVIRRELFEAAAKRVKLPSQALGSLASLSLIYWRPDEDFFELHPLIHEYAAARFRDDDGHDAAREALAEVLADFVAANYGQHPLLSAEFDNIWAAVNFVEAAGRWDLLLRFWPAVSHHLWAVGDRVRYRQLDERCLPGCRARGDLQTEATILSELCYVALEAGNYLEAERLGEASQKIYDQLGLAEYQLRLRRYRAIVIMRQGGLAEAEAILQEMYQLLGPSAAEPARPGHIADLGYAMLHNCHAGLAIRQGDYLSAWTKAAHGLELSQQLGKKDYTAMFLTQSGDVAYLLGQPDRAHEFWLEAAALERKPQVVGHATPEVLLRLAAYESLHGDRSRAVRLTHGVRRAYAQSPNAAAQAWAERLIAKIKSGDDPVSLFLDLLRDT